MMPSQTSTRTGTMQTGRWYAAAFDTDPFPASLALDTIEERLRSELHVGSIRLYQQREDVPSAVPAAVRDAPGADVWATGQYLGADASSPLPEQVLAVAEMPAPSAPVPARPAPPVPRPKGQPAPPGPRQPPAPAPPAQPAAKPIATSTLVAIGIGSIVVIGGGIALLVYMRRPRRNPRRARRRRRR